jgi:hypothetical protein
MITRFKLPSLAVRIDLIIGLAGYRGPFPRDRRYAHNRVPMVILLNCAEAGHFEFTESLLLLSGWSGWGWLFGSGQGCRVLGLL